MTMFFVRAVGAGGLVAALPYVARGFGGTRLAAILMLFPLVTLASFVVLNQAGTPAVELASIARNGFVGVIAVATFLFAVAALLERGFQLRAALMIGLCVWTITAFTLVSSGLIKEGNS